MSRTGQLLGKAIVDFAAYQMPFVIAGLQQMAENFFALLLFVDVAGDVHGADRAARIIPQRSRGDEEIAAEVVVMHFRGVRPAIGQSKRMRAEGWRLA